MEIRGSNPLGGTTRRAPCYHRPRWRSWASTIRTIISDNVATRCDGCNEIIEGTPWRVNVLDIVAPESPVDWTDTPLVNPGPFQFHGDPAHVRVWMARKGYLFCRRGEVREIMRPVPIPARTAVSACATASIATTTSSSRPDLPEGV